MESIVIIPILAVLGFGGVIALLVWAVVTQQRKARARVLDLQGFAAHRGWRFTADGSGLEQRFEGAPFGRGFGQAATKVLEGTHHGWPFIAFDYSYVTSGGRDRGNDHHHFSVVSMHLGVAVPRLQIHPQTALARFFSDSFGGDYHIGYPAFDDVFHIDAQSPEFAHAVLTPQMCQLLLATRGRALRFERDSLVMFRAGVHEPAEVDAVLELMRQILETVPTPVWERLHGDVGPRDR